MYILKHTMLIIVILLSLSFSQDPNKPWERLGLSQTEWKMIQDNHLPESKVEQLLKDGIGIAEYLQRPWVELNMSEVEWIKKRRSGMSNSDIESEVNAQNTRWEKEIQKDTRSDMKAISRNGEQFKALFLPGMYQFQHKRPVQGSVMVTLAASSVLWCTAGSISKKKFQAIPVFALLVPDMIWSFIDYKRGPGDR